MKISTLVKIIKDNGFTKEHLNTLFINKSLPLVEKTIIYLASQEGCGENVYREALDNGTIRNCCEHFINFYSDLYINLIVINSLHSIKSGLKPLSIKDCNFYGYTFTVSKDSFTDDELEYIDFSGVTLSLDDREHCLDYYGSERGLVEYETEDKEDTISFEVSCTSIEEAKETFEDCPFNLTIEDLTSKDLKVTMEVFCDPSLVNKVPKYLKGEVNLRINAEFYTFPLNDGNNNSALA